MNISRLLYLGVYIDVDIILVFIIDNRMFIQNY